MAALQHASNGRIDLRLDVLVLRLKVQERYSHGGACHSQSTPVAELLILSRVGKLSNREDLCQDRLYRRAHIQSRPLISPRRRYADSVPEQPESRFCTIACVCSRHHPHSWLC